jgi:hypothetical protein
MKPGQIRQALYGAFQPFTLFMDDGRKVDVLSREYAWLKPGTRRLFVSVPRKAGANEEADFENYEIDVASVANMAPKIDLPPGATAVNPWYERLREFYYRTPFRPFVIRTRDGDSITIKRPLEISFTPMFKTISVSDGAGSRRLLVSEILEVGEARGRRRARSKT